MRLGHFSDLHGNISHIEGSPEVWVCSGDFFPNETRGIVAEETVTQTAWFNAIVDELIARLGGKPVIWVGGNHDFVNLAKLLTERGYPAFDATEGMVEFGGHRFAGFREVPFMAGEWAGETHDLNPMVDRAFEMNPTILVTHAPPAGILDNDNGCGHGCGVRPLATALAYRPHNIVAHLFGHIHADNGHIEEMGIRFFNGAGTCRIIEVP